MNALFATYKPPFVSSSKHLLSIKKRYGVSKCGYSGTLDPFAKGVLVVAFGKYTKLFRFLDSSPKRYKATLWLGAMSDSLDIEGVKSVESVPYIEANKILLALDELKGEISYTPPKFSAKKVDGRRAYKLAREGLEFELKSSIMRVYKSELINYSFPFITFDITVDKGSYIRSYGELLAKKIGSFGALSSLERIEEGKFVYNDEKFLDPLKFLNIEENFYFGCKEDLLKGIKIELERLQKRDRGVYYILLEDFFTIIEIDDSVKYLINRIDLC